MGGSKVIDLPTMISKMMKTANQHEQRVRYISTREEAINRCLISLIHALNCREGATCTAAGCQKMKRVVEHTRTCQRKTSNYRGCTICSQLMSLCFYHSKICRQSVCRVPFCRIMKRKLQAINEQHAQQESVQSLKPVPQFVIPPINALSPPSPTSKSRSDSSPSSEPSPKRLRKDDETTSSENHEAKHSDMINNETHASDNDRLKSAQHPQTTEVM